VLALGFVWCALAIEPQDNAAPPLDEPPLSLEPLQEPPPDVDAWVRWLDEAHLMLGPHNPTGAPPLAEIISLTDQQVRYLGGDRTALQSLTTDSSIDVAVRPLALDLFGFSLARVQRIAVSQYRHNHPDRPVTLVDTGDLVDLGCRKELPLVFAAPEHGRPAAQPDLIAVGNHDVNFAGTFRKGSDLFGLSSLNTGGSLKVALWGPNCGARSDARWAAEPAQIPKRFASELSVILEKDGYASWWTDRMLGAEVRPVILERANGRGYRLKGGPFTDWSDAKAVRADFWRAAPGDPDTWAASVRRADTCRAGPQPNCREAGRGILLVAAHRMVPGEEIWLVALDSTDQLRNNPQVPGMYASFSVVQTRILEAFLAARRNNASKDTPARFVLASHYPLFDIIWERNLARSGMDAVLGAEDVMAMLVGHTHIPGIEPVNYDNHLAVARRRVTPMVQYVAGSVLDHPSGGMRLSFVEEQIGGQAVIRPVAYHVDSIVPPPVTSAYVLAELDSHSHALTSYRNVGSRLREWRWERAMHRGRFGATMQRFLLQGWKIQRDDSRLVMIHQYEEMVSYLASVNRLLEHDQALSRPVHTARTHLADLYQASVRRLDHWRTSSPVCSPDTNWRSDCPAADLFQFNCDEAIGVVPANAFFPVSVNCVEAIQYALRDIPEDTMAFEFMYRMAAEAALQEYCTSADTPPGDEACTTPWFVGPHTPRR
jgi:hypothetical protein